MEARTHKCPKCRQSNVKTDGKRPPDRVTAKCKSCGHTWAICGAGPDTERGPCFKRPMRGKDRCERCGGKSPGAPIIHGGRSKYMPRHLAAKFNEAVDDPELLSLKQDIATNEAWIRSLWEEFDGLTEGNSPAQLWGMAIDLYERGHEEKTSEEDRAKIDKQLYETLKNGLGASQRSTQIRQLQEEKRRLVDTETKRMNFDASNLDAKEVEVLVATVVDLLRAFVPDDATVANRFLQALKARLSG